MRVPALLLALAAAACGDEREHADAARPAAARDTTLAVTGPTFIALFGPVTQAQVDAEPGLGEALADFRHSAEQIAPCLAAAGITAHQVYADTLRLVHPASSSARWTFGADSTRYVYLAPGREPQTLPGIATDFELLQTAAEYFRISSLAPDQP